MEMINYEIVANLGVKANRRVPLTTKFLFGLSEGLDIVPALLGKDAEDSLAYGVLRRVTGLPGDIAVFRPRGNPGYRSHIDVMANSPEEALEKVKNNFDALKRYYKFFGVKLPKDAKFEVWKINEDN